MSEYPLSRGTPDLGSLDISKYPYHAHEPVQERLNELVAENLDDKIRGRTLDVPFYVDFDQTKAFDKLTSYIIKSKKNPDGTLPPINTHWKLAGLHRIAEHEIGHLRDKEGYYEVGGMPDGTHHTDNRIDAHDESRWRQKHRIIGADELTRIFNGTHAKGAERCALPCDDALAMFSTHDMTYRQIYQIFRIKGLQTMTCAMLLPIKYYNSKMSFTDVEFGIHWRHEGDDLVMCMPDSANIYRHKRSTIEQWLTQVAYNAKDFNLTFEVMRNYGPLCFIKVCRVYHGGVIGRTLRQPRNLVKVPDFTSVLPIIKKLTSTYWYEIYTPDKFYEIFKDIKTYDIPPSMVEKSAAWLFNRDHKSVTLNHTGSYLSGLQYQVTVREWCIQEGFQLPPEEHEGLANALLIRAMIVRWRSSQMISYLIQDIQKHEKDDFWTHISKIFNSISSPWTKSGWRKLANKGKEQEILNMSDAHYFLYCILKLHGEQAKVENVVLHGKQTAYLNYLMHERVATFNPDNAGYCYHECVKFEHGTWPNLPPNPTGGQILDYEAREGLSNNIEVKDGHATVEFKTTDVCEHMVRFEPKLKKTRPCDTPLVEDFKENLRGYYYDDGENRNLIKTESLRRLFADKKYWTNACAGPGNDSTLFPFYAEHWYRADGLGILRATTLHKSNVVFYNKNVNCIDCLKTARGLLYCDFGVEAEEAPERVTYALKQIRKSGKQFIFKIQDFYKTVNASEDLDTMISDLAIIKVTGASPWERFVTNMIKEDVHVTLFKKEIRRVWRPFKNSPEWSDRSYIETQKLVVKRCMISYGRKFIMTRDNIIISHEDFRESPPPYKVEEYQSSHIEVSDNAACKAAPSEDAAPKEGIKKKDEEMDLIEFPTEVDNDGIAETTQLDNEQDGLPMSVVESPVYLKDWAEADDYECEREIMHELLAKDIWKEKKLRLKRKLKYTLIWIASAMKRLKPTRQQVEGCNICLCEIGECRHPYRFPSAMAGKIISFDQLPEHKYYYGHWHKNVYVPKLLREVTPSKHTYQCTSADAQVEMARLKADLKQPRDSKYYKSHERAIAMLDHTVLKEQLEFEAVLGNPGAGKSSWLRKQIIKDRYFVDAIVTPTKHLADEYNDKLKAEVLGDPTIKKMLVDGGKLPQAMTFARAIATITEDMVIAIDEAFALDPRVLWFLLSRPKKAIILGDDRQQHFDLGNLRLPTAVPGIANYVTDASRLETSFTVPLDVTAYCRSYFNYCFRTLSKVTKSVDVRFSPAMKETPDLTMTYSTQSSERRKCHTIASIQGSRPKRSRLFITRACHRLALLVPAQHYVALTRHTHAMEVIVEAESSMQIFPAKKTIKMDLNEKVGSRNRYPTIYGPSSNVDTIIEEGDFNFQKGEPSQDYDYFPNTVSHGIASAPLTFSINQSIHSNIHGLDYEMVGDNLQDTLLPYDPVEDTIGNWGVDNDSVQYTEEILSQIAPAMTAIADHKRETGYTHFGAPNKYQKLHLKTNQRPLIHPYAKPGVHALSMGRTRGRQQTSNDLDHCIMAVLSRQTHLKKRMSRKDVYKLAMELWIGLNKFVDLEKLASMKLTQEELTQFLMRLLENINKKKDPQRQDEGLYGESSRSTNKILLFNKRQHKNDPKPDGAFRGDEKVVNSELEMVPKCGQIISAQPKTLNHIAAPYTMALENRLKACLRKGVLLPNGEDPKVFKKEVNARLKMKGDFQNVACDISEQDTTKTEATHLVFRWLFEAIGVPSHTYDIVQQACIRWTGFGLDFSINNVETFQSGINWTYLNNTVDSMARIGASFEIEGLRLAMFKGDDAYVSARKVDYVNKRKELKVERGTNLPFVGFIVTETGLGLDLPRLCSKVLNKTYSDDKDVQEYIVAVKDWINHISCRDEIAASCAAVQQYYGCTQMQSEALWSFLYNYSKGKVITSLRQRTANVTFSQLYKVVLKRTTKSKNNQDKL